MWEYQLSEFIQSDCKLYTCASPCTVSIFILIFHDEQSSDQNEIKEMYFLYPGLYKMYMACNCIKLWCSKSWQSFIITNFFFCSEDLYWGNYDTFKIWCGPDYSRLYVRRGFNRKPIWEKYFFLVLASTLADVFCEAVGLALHSWLAAFLSASKKNYLHMNEESFPGFS